VGEVREAWANLAEPEDDQLQRRIRIIAASRAARAAALDTLEADR